MSWSCGRRANTIFGSGSRTRAKRTLVSGSAPFGSLICRLVSTSTRLHEPEDPNPSPSPCPKNRNR